MPSPWPQTPKARHQSFYFLAFGHIAFFLAFLPLVWQEAGFTKSQMASLSLASTVASLFAAPFALNLAHRVLGARYLVVGFFVLALLCFLPQVLSTNYLLLLVTWALCSVAFKGMFSIIDARAVRAGEEGQFIFERVRIWGSVGYVFFTLACGVVADYLGASAIALSGFCVLCCAGLGVLICRPLLAEKPAVEELVEKAENKTSFKGFLLPVAALFLINALIWGSHSAYYVYYSVFLQELGYSSTAISFAWIIGVVAEVLYFQYFSKFESSIGLQCILRQAIVFTALRWLMLATSSALPVLLVVQLLHLFSFGACYLASVKLTYKLLPEELRDRGQGWLAAFGPGAGSSIGRLVLSYLAVSWTTRELFLGSVFVAALAFPLSYLLKVKED